MSAVESLVVSKWGGENQMEVPQDPEKRKKSVWIESTRSTSLSASSALSPSEFCSLIVALSEEEGLTLVHEQEDFITEWNAASGGLAWGRVRRYSEITIPSDSSASVVYEDAAAVGLVKSATKAQPKHTGLTPLVSSFAVQQSVAAAAEDAWVRVVGVAKYDNVSFGIIQEYDGSGCIVALLGGELKPQFMVEVAMAFSDAMYRRSHEMWISARYGLFRYRFATWTVPVKDEIGPCAAPFHACLVEAFLRIGYQEAGVALVKQLERVKEGFASGNEKKLFDDAKCAMDASSGAARDLLRHEE